MAFSLGTDVFVRAQATVFMVAIFALMVACGHAILIPALALVQACALNETLRVSLENARSKTMSSSKPLGWYIFCVALLYSYGENLSYYLNYVVSTGSLTTIWAIGYHRFISLLLYLASFANFVGNANMKEIREQLKHFVATHFAVLWIVIPGHFAAQAMLEGLIWFLLPAALVVMNDVFAYKTVEGFVGAWLITLTSSIMIARLLQQHDSFTCRGNSIGTTIWTSSACRRSEVFMPTIWDLPYIDRPISIAPVYIHALFLANGASLIAPFGGFFASSVKRSLKIKDFGHMIPEHGGAVDRIDCQLVMMLVACAYYHAFVFADLGSNSHAALMMASDLTQDQKIDLVKHTMRDLLKAGVPVDHIRLR